MRYSNVFFKPIQWAEPISEADGHHLKKFLRGAASSLQLSIDMLREGEMGPMLWVIVGGKKNRSSRKIRKGPSGLAKGEIDVFLSKTKL